MKSRRIINWSTVGGLGWDGAWGESYQGSNLKIAESLTNSVGLTIPVYSIAYGHNNQNSYVATNSRNIPTESNGLLFFQFYSYSAHDSATKYPNGDNGTPRMDFQNNNSDVVASLLTNDNTDIVLSSQGNSYSFRTLNPDVSFNTQNTTNLNLILFDFENK